MIDKFKKSHLGQMLLISFVVASVVAGSVIWFYESIRIPTMTGQLAFRDDKIRSLENAAAKEKEKTKELTTTIEKEKLELDKWKINAKQTSDELSYVGEQLRLSQKKHLKITQELTSTKMKLKSALQKNVVVNPPINFALSFEDAVLSVADHEDTAFLTIGNYVTELRLFSYHMFMQDYQSSLTKLLTLNDPDYTKSFTTDMFSKSIAFRDFVLTLEGLRVYVMKRILDYYREKLTKFNNRTTANFLSDVRQQTAILTELGKLTKKLKSNDNPTGWNLSATKTVNNFMGTNKAPTDVNSKNGDRIEGLVERSN